MTSARDLMTRGPECAAEEVLHRLAEHQLRRISIVDNGRLVGIISQAGIARQAPNAVTGAVVHDVSR